ncbi:MAG: T9SS type A sorting domain-containing protein, partial [Bacteroidia bacterium]|nr:T9SS type A sorting domain-containing protein [Bacteroidia bacterium]
MSRSALLTILMFCSIVSSGQNISVTFTGTGAVTQIDSVTATNQRTNQRVTLPGNETLVLTVNTGISSVSELTNQGVVFPNPFSGKATFTAVVQKPQTVYLNVRNLVGQVVAQTQVFLQPGENLFDLSLATAGIYMVTLTTEEAKSSYKIICIGANTAGNSIQYLSAGSNNHNTQNNQNSPPGSALKSLTSGYTLGYTAGDVILYRCRSAIYTTIVTDTMPSSKNYEVVFAACTGPDGKNYSVVNIGTQTWMAENLAYLPSVSPSDDKSEADPYYYVYGYEGSTVASAKASANYTTYGVLYNWPAALSACPAGWHLPTDDEWKILEKNQGMSESDANSEGFRTSRTVGGKMKETGTSHWTSPNTGATNTSGFTVLPGGDRLYSGGFGSLGDYAYFWSSSEGGFGAWYRGLYYGYGGVARPTNSLSIGFSARCLQNDSNTAQLPTISTNSITDITQTSATSGGNVTSDGGAAVTSRGVCWNTTGSPTTGNSKTTDGTGTGAFTNSLTGLTAGTPYYVRAYATNSVGTAYGEVRQFTTEGGGGDGTFDYEGRTYAFKTIGTQTWMVENLAYLPSVSPSSSGSDTSSYYYVYGYEGATVSTAKVTANYTTYGVLYNWPAALSACPAGWHLPTDDEWK